MLTISSLAWAMSLAVLTPTLPSEAPTVPVLKLSIPSSASPGYSYHVSDFNNATELTVSVSGQDPTDVSVSGIKIYQGSGSPDWNDGGNSTTLPQYIGSGNPPDGHFKVIQTAQGKKIVFAANLDIDKGDDVRIEWGWSGSPAPTISNGSWA